MELLNVDALEDLMHSSTVSKGIERTMERMMNELEFDGIYIVRFNEELMESEVMYEWESSMEKKEICFSDYFRMIEEWYHFDENDLYIVNKVSDLGKEEKKVYQRFGFETMVEFQLKNHGVIVGYIVFGWNDEYILSEEEESDLHILLKLLNEALIKEFDKEVLGESEWNISQLATKMTKTMIYIVDEDHRIQYMNNYAKEECPGIKIGDLCYETFRGEKSPCADCPYLSLEEGQCDTTMYLPYMQDTVRVSATKVSMAEKGTSCLLAMQNMSDIQFADNRKVLGKKFIFSLAMLYKDVLSVDLRNDTFYDLLEKKADNKHSYSVEFVLKWLDKVHLDDKQKFLECFDINYLQKAYENGDSYKELDFRYRTHQGSYQCMNGQILFEHNKNKDMKVYVLFQNVEELRQAQLEEATRVREALMAARSAAELKGQVLANISHEIRTPMSGIISMASVAKQVYKEEKKLLECLSNIDRYAEHMMRVMDSLLETVKVDHDSITIAKQEFRLEGLLNRIDIAVREKIEKKNVDFEIDMKSQYNHLIGDEIRLQQAVVVLINNAILYTPMSGSIHLTAKQIAADNKIVYIRFLIDDTGNGLTDKMKQSIFGFDNRDGKEVINEEHFDLSLASRIIQLMGGEIGVDVNDSGTHLYFTLPFEIKDEGKRSKSVRRKKTKSIGDFTGKKVLIVEDSDMAQDALRAVLEVVGFKVDTAENGKKAVIQFISQPAFTYDAILMDVHMPLMDGREATRCIRISGKEDADSIPIVGLMANTYEEDKEESLKAGMQAHLAKPVDVDTLYKVLRKLIPENEVVD